MKLKFYIAILTLVWTNLIQSQSLDIGFSFNPGASKLAWEGLKTSIQTKWSFSGNAGMYLNKKIGKRSAIGFELLYTVFESKEILENKLFTFDPMTLEQIILGYSKDETKSHLTYVSLPIYYKFSFKKIIFKGGLQAMYLSKASFDTQIDVMYNGVTTTNKSNGNIKRINKFDLGPKLGIQYILSERALLGLEYYHGLRQLGDKDAPFKRLNRQATLGLQYSLTKSNVKS